MNMNIAQRLGVEGHNVLCTLPLPPPGQQNHTVHRSRRAHRVKLAARYFRMSITCEDIDVKNRIHRLVNGKRRELNEKNVLA